MAPVRIFISSVQKEFASERAALRYYPTHYIDHMGTGTRHIIRHCRDRSLPEPAFTVTDGFVISLRRPEPPTPQVTPQVDQQFKALQDKALSDLVTILSLSTPQATPQVAPQVAKVGGQVAGQVTGQVEEEGRRFHRAHRPGQAQQPPAEIPPHRKRPRMAHRAGHGG